MKDKWIWDKKLFHTSYKMRMLTIHQLSIWNNDLINILDKKKETLSPNDTYINNQNKKLYVIYQYQYAKTVKGI